MNKAQLRLELQNSGVRTNSYSLDEPSDETYCLNGGDVSWSVYYFERGIESGKKMFATESDACIYLLGLLRNDPTAKQH